MRGNMHLHSTGSDGKHTPEEMIEEANNKGLAYICFTDHKRMNGENWALNFFDEEYVKNITSLKEKYKNKINIMFGVEIDWFNDYKKEINNWLKKYNFDFIVGAVHIIKMKNGEYLKVNYDLDKLNNKINEIGIKEIIKEYYNHIKKLIKSEICDCIAHLDIIKTYNRKNILFDEDSSFYKKEVLSVLNEIKKYNKCIEINTSGLFYDCNKMFPSLWILKEAKKRGIPITIGTDAHWKERIEDGLQEAYQLAKTAGYDKILIFQNRKPIEVLI